MCNGCRDKCASGISEQEPAEIECPICSGEGCEHCKEGTFSLVICAHKYITSDIVKALQYAALVEKGLLPQAGGLVNQSAWFVNAVMSIRYEQNRIDQERFGSL